MIRPSPFFQSFYSRSQWSKLGGEGGGAGDGWSSAGGILPHPRYRSAPATEETEGTGEGGQRSCLLLGGGRDHRREGIGVESKIELKNAAFNSRFSTVYPQCVWNKSTLCPPAPE